MANQSDLLISGQDHSLKDANMMDWSLCGGPIDET